MVERYAPSRPIGEKDLFFFVQAEYYGLLDRYRPLRYWAKQNLGPSAAVLGWNWAMEEEAFWLIVQWVDNTPDAESKHRETTFHDGGGLDALDNIIESLVEPE